MIHLFKNIEIEKTDNIAHLWFNRPDKHNAFNEEMLREIIICLRELKKEKVAFLVVRGRGSSFCSGADFNWFENTTFQGEEIANLMSECLQEVYRFPRPVIAFVHGNTMGGGIGLMCAADVAIAEENTVFAFPEVKIGLAPAVISPYILKRLNSGIAKYLMFTTKKINSREAHEINLVDLVIESSKIDEIINEFTEAIIAASPLAVEETKALLNNINSSTVNAEAIKLSISTFSKLKNSDDHIEGLKAIKEKRKPNWKN